MSETHGTINEPSPQRAVANLDPDQLSTNEGRTIPLFAGEAQTAALWIGQVFDQYTVDAPVERPGKK